MKKIVLVVVLGLFFSCTGSNSSDCEPSALPFTNLEAEYGCVNTKYLLYNIVQGDNFIIIRNQIDFENMTDDVACRPQIDFTTYDLIIGKKQLTSGNQSIQYEYMDNCTEKVLTVTFVQDETMVAPTIIYHALIPKLAPGEQVAVETIIE
ncbi:hypothetical protein L1S35_10555 [Flavobacterium sp. AS60]|uniref:hypothetical protein n=1 Tax=Flavobacterium anseongense TaxID=2910677 RepID=UPI001F2C84B1|nr:hypothetical protein [Flavobacterium sp. AS60]MCF6130117.1 hypothetical protein [Flavobacterium sp. AS60]